MILILLSTFNPNGLKNSLFEKKFPFFAINENLKWGYLMGGILLLLCVIPLILNYKNFPEEKS